MAKSEIQNQSNIIDTGVFRIHLIKRNLYKESINNYIV